MHRCVSECVFSERNSGANSSGRWHSIVPFLALNSSVEVCVCVCVLALNFSAEVCVCVCTCTCKGKRHKKSYTKGT